MKKSIAVLFLLLPLIALAQPRLEMSEEAIQNMMQQMQKMQTCMQDIDKSKLQELENLSNQMEAEIKTACAKGNRDAAQSKAMSFAKEMLANPELGKMRKCTESMQGMMQEIPFEINVDDYKDQHVCDE